MVTAGGGLNSTYYGYEEAVFNRRGRGFQGFRRMLEETNTPEDTANDLRTVTDFHQVFPLAGRMKSRQQTSQINYLGAHALPGGLPAGFSAADVTGEQTVTELFGWNTIHRKPACVSSSVECAIVAEYSDTGRAGREQRLSATTRFAVVTTGLSRQGAFDSRSGDT